MASELNETPEVTRVPPGMAGERESSEQRVAPTESVDVEKLKQEAEEARRRTEEIEARTDKDMNQLRQSLDQRYSRDMGEAQKRLDSYETRMHSAAMSNMEEGERVTYQLQVETEKRQRLEQELSRAQDLARQAQDMGQYAQDFMRMGASYEDLDFTGGPQALAASGWQAVEKHQQDLEAEVVRLKEAANAPQIDETAETQVTPTPVIPGAPPIVTQHGQQQSTNRSINDVVQSLNTQYPDEKFTIEKVYDWVERGQLPANLFEGIDW